MQIHEKIREELKEAMKARDTGRMEVLRGFLAAFTNELVSKRRLPQEMLSDDDALSVISRQAKQRKDSILQFEKGGRADLVEMEKKELAIIETYLPMQMGREEIKKIAEEKKAELGIADKSKIGILIGALMKELKGKADGADVKAIVGELLS